ncbi:MAG: hypothetical protein CL450_08800 [Acidimicrobiaceae bacterium]|nr:hypothetical protein [Acidimicrobiaceae bacterium]
MRRTKSAILASEISDGVRDLRRRRAFNRRLLEGGGACAQSAREDGTPYYYYGENSFWDKDACEKAASACGTGKAECCASADGFRPSQQSLYGYEEMCDERTGHEWVDKACHGNPAAATEKDCVCAAPKTFTSKDDCEEHAVSAALRKTNEDIEYASYLDYLWKQFKDKNADSMSGPSLHRMLTSPHFKYKDTVKTKAKHTNYVDEKHGGSMTRAQFDRLVADEFRKHKREPAE